MEPSQTDVEHGLPVEGRRYFQDYHIHLHKAALSDNWGRAEEIYKEHPDCFLKRISKNGDTALHIAAAAGRKSFVKNLLATTQLTDEQLELRNYSGDTAFCLAAASGVVAIAVEMERHNPNLRNIGGSSGMKPIHMAALGGHQQMVNHLMSCVDNFYLEERMDLLISVIDKELYDVALEMVMVHKELAINRDGNSKTPLHVLATKTQTKSPSHLKYSWNAMSNLKKEQQKDEVKLKLVQLLWEKVLQQNDHEEISQLLWFPSPGLIFVAVEKGNYEFMRILIDYYPDLLWEKDEQNRTIFHAAVEYRQEKIFSHICQLGSINHLLIAFKNPFNNNNILHLAATLPCSERLAGVFGAALQMQRELLWFQAVEKIVPHQFANSKNSIIQSNGTQVEETRETPQEMFSREHAELRKEGEKWMRDTANSCMLVAVLVAAIVFQAVFQPPENRNNEKLFWAFVISDAFSLLSSTASILTFLAILTSTYAEKDFLMLLPLKLMVGLAMLLFSILTMLLAFTMSIILLLPNKSCWSFIAALAWLIGVIYVWLHFRLLVAVYRSTFEAKYLFCPQHELFQD